MRLLSEREQRCQLLVKYYTELELEKSYDAGRRSLHGQRPKIVAKDQKPRHEDQNPKPGTQKLRPKDKV